MFRQVLPNSGMGLYPLELYTKEEAGAVIDLIESCQKKFYDRVRTVILSTPVMNGILPAERDFPEEERYDGYIQLENGVGMMRLFIEEFEEAVKHLEGKPMERTLTIATGKLTYPTIRQFAEQLMKLYPGSRGSCICNPQ